MRDDDESHIFLLAELSESGHDFASCGFVERARWFIAQEQFRPEEEGSGDGNALFLSA